ncbi:MAG: hypothetical protein IJI85_04695 [Clostridia bacterium]|nr:hypothetical protein [Clostridia bacterium]
MKKTNAGQLQKWTDIEDFVKQYGDYSLEALKRESKKRRISLNCLLLDFISNYCDDEFADYCFELAEKYNVQIPDEGELFGHVPL